MYLSVSSLGEVFKGCDSNFNVNYYKLLQNYNKRRNETTTLY